MCVIIYKLTICLLGTYVYLLLFSPFNLQVFNVSNCVLLDNYMVFMNKTFNHVVSSMTTFSHVVISMVTIRHKNMAYDYMTKKWSLIIFVLVINVKLWCNGIYRV